MEKDLLDVKKFNIEQLDQYGRSLLVDFETLFINLRRKKNCLPDAYFTEASDILMASFIAQSSPIKKALRHFTGEYCDDLRIGCEMNSIANEQLRLKTRGDFLDEQKRQKNWLPAKYYFWDRVWYLAKWIGFPLTITYYICLLPGKIRDKVKLAIKAKHETAVGTHAGTTGTIHVTGRASPGDETSGGKKDGGAPSDKATSVGITASGRSDTEKSDGAEGNASRANAAAGTGKESSAEGNTGGTQEKTGTERQEGGAENCKDATSAAEGKVGAQGDAKAEGGASGGDGPEVDPPPEKPPDEVPQRPPRAGPSMSALRGKKVET